MKSHHWLFILALTASSIMAAEKPNIILIITDDQGYGDLSCHGNPVLKTPHLDKLHAGSRRFTNFHVSPTCAPTRSALMTGRHEFRNGVTHTILERERLTLDAVTLPQVLKSAGYTTGIFGKWHLGDEDAYRPDRRGFDETFIHGGGGIGQSYPGSCGDAPGNTYFNPAILHNGRFVKTDGYCTDVFFNQATRWIESKQGKQPFFAYIATNAPHAPLQVRKEDEARYAKIPGVSRDVAKFFGMIANIDDNVGRLMSKLEQWGIARNTLVIFMNDNGGTKGTAIFNAGMRGSKGSTWRGGTRAASFWHWPGTLAAGDVNALAAHIDMMPTLVEIAGATPSAAVTKQIEGRNLMPLLRDPSADWPERTLTTHVGRWPKGADVGSFKHNKAAIRDSRWQLHFAPTGPQQRQLFDLAADPGEENNVAEEHPEVVARMEKLYDSWWQSVVPMMVNEAATGPAENPFKTIYQKQAGDSTRGKTD